MSSRLCSHCSLNETIRGDFGLSAEELETLNADKMFARALKQSETGRDWHNYQMETNYDEYSKKRAAYYAEDPERQKRMRTEYRESTKAQKTYYCETCHTNCPDSHELKKHQASSYHLTAVERMKRPYVCIPCVFGANKPAGLRVHLNSATHKKHVADYEKELADLADALSSSDELD